MACAVDLGAQPAHVLATNGSEDWGAKVLASFDSSPYGRSCKVYLKPDLWHLRSLLRSEPVDFLATPANRHSRIGVFAGLGRRMPTHKATPP